MFPLQGIKTWPTLNLSQLMSLPSQLGTLRSSQFQPVVPLEHDLDTNGIPVTTNQKIYEAKRVGHMWSDKPVLNRRMALKSARQTVTDHSSSPANSTVSARRDYFHD